MNTIRVEKTVERDGELRLTGLPFHKGDEVEGVLVIKRAHTAASRAEALRKLIEHANAHSFGSTRPYPTRDELHERD